jgi:hypothetical protein
MKKILFILLIIGVAFGCDAITAPVALAVPAVAAHTTAAHASVAPKPDEKKAKQWFIASAIYSVASIILVLLSYPILASVFAALGILSLCWGIYKRKN